MKKPGHITNSIAIKSRLGLILIITIVLATSPFISPALASNDDAAHLRILHFNDFHGHLIPFKIPKQLDPVGGMAFLAGAAKELRTDATLFLAAGDILYGTNESNFFKGEPVIKILNTLNIDALVIGNHEFDYGLANLETLAKKAIFPFLTANITGLQFVQPYLIKDVAGIKVAILGLTTPYTSILTHPGNVENLAFQDPISKAKELIPLIKKEARIIIALTHLGLEADKNLAEQVPEIDLIVGGHSHTDLGQPVMVGNTLIVQAHEYGKKLGLLDLTFKDGKIVLEKSRSIPIKPGMPEDRKVAGIIKETNNLLKEKFDVVVGQALVDFIGEGRTIRSRETNLGNLIADIMKEKTAGDAALINGGAIRGSITKGPITLGQIYTTLPFENYLVLLELTGAQLREALEHSVSQVEENSGRFLQVSGLSFAFDPGSPAGSRVSSVLISREPLNLTKTYVITTNDFLASGGDGYLVFKNARRILWNEPRPLKDLVLDHVRKIERLNPKTENRITDLSKPKN